MCPKPINMDTLERLDRVEPKGHSLRIRRCTRPPILDDTETFTHKLSILVQNWPFSVQKSPFWFLLPGWKPPVSMLMLFAWPPLSPLRQRPWYFDSTRFRQPKLSLFDGLRPIGPHEWPFCFDQFSGTGDPKPPKTTQNRGGRQIGGNPSLIFGFLEYIKVYK